MEKKCQSTCIFTLTSAIMLVSRGCHNISCWYVKICCWPAKLKKSTVKARVSFITTRIGWCNSSKVRCIGCNGSPRTALAMLLNSTESFLTIVRHPVYSMQTWRSTSAQKVENIHQECTAQQITGKLSWCYYFVLNLSVYPANLAG